MWGNGYAKAFQRVTWFGGTEDTSGSALGACVCILQSVSESDQSFLLGRERMLGVREAVGGRKI